MRHLIAALLLVLFSGACAAPHSTGSGTATRFTSVVAADHQTASAAGADALRQGGNAVDGAVAAAFTLSVVRPQSCGIGGGSFLVIWLPAGASRSGAAVCTTVDAREWCPEGVGAETFVQSHDAQASTIGGLAVAVPGTVAGLLHAQEKYGRLDRAAVLAPAIAAARRGFVVDKAYMTAADEAIARFNKDPDLRNRFPFLWDVLLKRGDVREGDLITNPDQALALERIARDGAAGFYSGQTGEAIAAAVSRSGGRLTRADLQEYATGGVRERTPLTSQAWGRTVLTMPPPSSGGVALCQTLAMLQTLYPAGPATDQAQFAHDLVECFKLSFADRACFMADPDFVPVPTARLISTEDIQLRAARIDRTRTRPPVDYRRSELLPTAGDDHGTSHVSAVDRWGGACAATQTINLFFGSYVCPPGCGFLLNNEMDDFTTDARRPNAFGLTQSNTNAPTPRKRPLSSMTPLIMVDRAGRVEFVAGASGGPRIITATAQAVLNVLMRGDDATSAVARPRLHHQWMPDVVRVEEDVPGDVRTGLSQRGHTLSDAKGEAAVQLIARCSTTGPAGSTLYTAASDSRKGGWPAGQIEPSPSLGTSEAGDGDCAASSAPSPGCR